MIHTKSPVKDKMIKKAKGKMIPTNPPKVAIPEIMKHKKLLVNKESSKSYLFKDNNMMKNIAMMKNPNSTPFDASFANVASPPISVASCKAVKLYKAIFMMVVEILNCKSQMQESQL